MTRARNDRAIEQRLAIAIRPLRAFGRAGMAAALVACLVGQVQGAGRGGDGADASRDEPFTQHSFSPATGSFANPAGKAASPRPAARASWYHGDWHADWAPAAGRYPGDWSYAGEPFAAGFAGASDAAAPSGDRGADSGVIATLLATASPWAYGYWGYTNPFYSPGLAWGGYDYSQPLALASGPASAAAATSIAVTPAATSIAVTPTAANPQSPNPNAEVPNAASANTASPNAPNPTAPAADVPGLLAGSQSPAVANVDPARDAFRRGDYQMALQLTDRDLRSQAGDPVLHQFRALCEFALGNYRQAAAGIYSVLAAGPGWDWTTIVNLYPSVEVYTRQLRALEAYSREKPQSAEAKFLLAYHYLVEGYDGAAEEQFGEVARMQPNNTVAAQLFKTLTNPSETDPTAIARPAPPDRSAPPIDAGALVGHWSAAAPDGGKFWLDLDPNQEFTWKFGRSLQASTLRGKYRVSGDLLILEGSDQRNLVGQVKLEAGNRLRFRLPNGAPNDPGLTFAR